MAIQNFVNTASTLADNYAMSGKKIVMAGTDSLSFEFAKNDLLYDRVHMIHTTYISYAEFNYLFSKDIMQYIFYGGTLTPENTFSSSDSLNEYFNTAIAGNIINSLNRWNYGVNYGTDILGELLDNGELQSAINKVIELNNYLFLARVINRKFNSCEKTAEKIRENLRTCIHKEKVI